MRKPPDQCSPHPGKAKKGDRSGSDDAASRLPVYVRYCDLQAAGIAGSWEQLYRLIDQQSFPPGVMLSANTRAWRLDEVEQWLASRPIQRKKVPPNRWQRMTVIIAAYNAELSGRDPNDVSVSDLLPGMRARMPGVTDAEIAEAMEWSARRQQTEAATV
jgi:predicted DNA-binding transcriptional regulator AlpA